MSDSLATIVPVVAFFLLGVALARVKLASDSDGHFLLRFLFFVAMPALSLVTLAGADLRADKALLPISCAIVNFVGLGVAWMVAKRRGLARPLLGATVLGTMILNNAFLVPFVLTGYGEDALTDLILFDLANAVIVSVVAFPLAYRFGGFDTDIPAGIRRAASAPFTWAIVAGIVLNLTETELPRTADRFLSPLGALVGPLILIALGILFKPSLADLTQVTTMVVLRMVGGLITGLVLVSAFGFSGDTRMVVLLAAAAPIGFTALTFSSMASLDDAAAARAVSASLFVAIIAVPIVIGLTS